MTMSSPSNPQRNAELAKIHLAAKELGLDREAYECMLWTVARVRSAKDLDSAGRRAVLDHLKARGFKGRAKGRSTPADDRAALINKIRRQMTEANVFSNYVDGMSKKMFQVERFEWCDPDQLRRLVAALNYHIKRRGRHNRRD